MNFHICTAELFSGRAADVWALGVTVYLLLFGTLPFSADNVPDLYHNIVNDRCVLLVGFVTYLTCAY